MDSLLKEVFAPLGQTPAVAHAPFGSPVTFKLRMPEPPRLEMRIDAMRTLKLRGLTVLRAKQTIEAMLEEGQVVVTLPLVEDARAVVNEIVEAGFEAEAIEPATVDISALRDRLGLTREEFAMRYGLEVETLRNWETGKREPDRTARSYLTAIANDPVRVEQAYAAVPAP